MKQVTNAAVITGVGVLYVGAFAVVAGFASQWNSVVIWPMAAVASVITLAAVGLAIFKRD